MEVNDSAAGSNDELLMRSGKNVVVEHWKSSRADSAAFTSELIGRLPRAAGNSGLPPMLPTVLPSKGLDTASIKYALGPASYQATGGVAPPQTVGFQKNAEAVTAPLARRHAPVFRRRVFLAGRALLSARATQDDR